MAEKNGVSSLVICVGISLNLAGMLTVNDNTLEDSYVAVHLSAITVECTVLLPLIYQVCIKNTT